MQTKSNQPSEALQPKAAAGSEAQTWDLAKQKEARKFTAVLYSGMVVLMTAATATMQARQLLIVEAAKQIDEAAVAAANSQLAAAYSIGAFAEFTLSPMFGSLSDRLGRKPVLLFLQVAPAMMRALVASITHAPTRVWLCCVDFFSARCLGVQPTVVMAGTMLTDVFPPEEQALARNRLMTVTSLGQIMGNYGGGWWSSRKGPASTYVLTAMGPLSVLAYYAALLPETNVNRGASAAIEAHSTPGGVRSKGADECGAELQKQKRGSVAVRVVSDVKLCVLAVTLGLYEFMNYAPLNSVAIYLMKERLGWGPLAAGRFASGFSFASFSGLMFARELIKLYGERTHVTVTTFMNALGFALWGSATNTGGMIATLLCFFFGTGGSPVIQTRFVQRALELGLTRGEAGAALQAIGALGRVLSPQLATKLWLRSVAQAKGPAGRFKMPAGSPMFAVALLSLMQELLHQASWRC